MGFKGKRVIVIGASSGMGFSTAKQLADQGAEVTICGRSLDSLGKAKEKLDGNVTVSQLDISKEDAVKKFFADLKTCDHIVCTGGYSKLGTTLEISSEDAKESFNNKFFGQFYVVKYGAPCLRRGGCIVLFSGILSVRPQPGMAMLSAVDGAVESLVRSAAIELAPDEKRVNCIAPGLVKTARFDQISEADRAKFLDKVDQTIPLKRMGTAEEAASSVLHLLENPYITGTVLNLDGGVTMK